MVVEGGLKKDLKVEGKTDSEEARRDKEGERREGEGALKGTASSEKAEGVFAFEFRPCLCLRVVGFGERREEGRLR